MKKSITCIIVAALIIGATAFTALKHDGGLKDTVTLKSSSSTAMMSTADTAVYEGGAQKASSAGTAGLAPKSAAPSKGAGGEADINLAKANPSTAKANVATNKTDSKTIAAPNIPVQQGTVPGQPQKLVYNLNYNVETVEYDSSIAKIEEIVKKYNGMIENSSFSTGGTKYNGVAGNKIGLRSANYAIRISSDKLDAFEQEFNGVGNILNRNKSTQDMSKQYYDTQSRIDALKVQQKRLLELLSQAKDIKDIIQIESRLSDVNYQLDSFTADNRYIDNLVDYSTVDINLREVLKEQIINNAPKNIFEEIAQTFIKSVISVGNSFKEFIVFFIGNLPEILVTIVVWAAVIFVCYKIYIVVSRHIKNKIAKAKPVAAEPEKTEIPEKPEEKN